jgi:hypothetical protein
MIAFLPRMRLRITTLVPRIEKHVEPVGMHSLRYSFAYRDGHHFPLIERCCLSFCIFRWALLGIGAFSTRACRVPRAQGVIDLAATRRLGLVPQSEQTLRGGPTPSPRTVVARTFLLDSAQSPRFAVRVMSRARTAFLTLGVLVYE